MVKKYREIGDVVEAIQWTNDNKNEVIEFLNKSKFYDGDFYYFMGDKDFIFIHTAGKDHIIYKGAFIVKYINSEIKIYEPSVFKRLYKEEK